MTPWPVKLIAAFRGVFHRNDHPPPRLNLHCTIPMPLLFLIASLSSGLVMSVPVDFQSVAWRAQTSLS